MAPARRAREPQLPPRSAPPQPRPASPPPATEPPPPGTYAYTITQDGQKAAAELTVEDVGDQAATTAQEQTWTTPDGTQRSRVGWSAAAELLTWTASDDPAGCSYAPEVLWLKLPLAAGAQWQGQSSCSYDAGGTPVRVVQSTAARVVTAASTSFDGRRVFCWVIERDVVTTATTDGSSATSETRTTDLFAPSWGLVVYETGKSAAPRADGTVDTGTWTVQLQE